MWNVWNRYEIAIYGGLAQLITMLEIYEIAGLLEQTLEEEKETNARLTEIAESDVKYAAAQEEQE